MNVAPDPCTLSTIRSPPKSCMMEREMLESEAGAVSGSLGREEGIEDVIQRVGRDAGTRVGDGNRRRTRRPSG